MIEQKFFVLWVIKRYYFFGTPGTHFKLLIAVSFNHCSKESPPSFDLPFGTLMTNLQLFHLVEKILRLV